MDFDTGKYAAFIWPAFGVTFLMLAGIVIDSLWRVGHWRREAERLQADKDARKKASKP